MLPRRANNPPHSVNQWYILRISDYLFDIFTVSLKLCQTENKLPFDNLCAIYRRYGPFHTPQRLDVDIYRRADP